MTYEFAHQANHSVRLLPPEALEPNEQNIATLMMGDYVKVQVLCRNGKREAFWGTFAGATPNGIKLVVDNDLVLKDEHGIDYLSKITVQKHNVLGIIKC